MSDAPSSKAPVILADEIAQLLGWSRPTFLRRRKDLILRDGMPSPLPGARLRWHRDSIERWLATYGELKTRADGRALSTVRIHIDRERLTEKYAHGVAA